MRTYRDLLRAPEFRPIFLTSAVQVAAQTVSGLALGTLIYLATGSALLSALGMFGPRTSFSRCTRRCLSPRQPSHSRPSDIRPVSCSSSG